MNTIWKKFYYEEFMKTMKCSPTINQWVSPLITGVPFVINARLLWIQEYVFRRSLYHFDTQKLDTPEKDLYPDLNRRINVYEAFDRHGEMLFPKLEATSIHGETKEWYVRVCDVKRSFVIPKECCQLITEWPNFNRVSVKNDLRGAPPDDPSDILLESDQMGKNWTDPVPTRTELKQYSRKLILHVPRVEPIPMSPEFQQKIPKKLLFHWEPLKCRKQA